MATNLNWLMAKRPQSSSLVMRFLLQAADARRLLFLGLGRTPSPPSLASLLAPAPGPTPVWMANQLFLQQQKAADAPEAAAVSDAVTAEEQASDAAWAAEFSANSTLSTEEALERLTPATDSSQVNAELGQILGSESQRDAKEDAKAVALAKANSATMTAGLKPKLAAMNASKPELAVWRAQNQLSKNQKASLQNYVASQQRAQQNMTNNYFQARARADRKPIPSLWINPWAHLQPSKLPFLNRRSSHSRRRRKPTSALGWAELTPPCARPSTQPLPSWTWCCRRCQPKRRTRLRTRPSRRPRPLLSRRWPL